MTKIPSAPITRASARSTVKPSLYVYVPRRVFACAVPFSRNAARASTRRFQREREKRGRKKKKNKKVVRARVEHLSSLGIYSGGACQRRAVMTIMVIRSRKGWKIRLAL